MKSELLERIKTLPPLPKTLIEVQAICDQPDGTVAMLSKVIEHDPMIVANMLKSANSPLFGFGKEITAVSQAVSLFGMSMTRSIAVNASVKKLLSVDLKPYNVTPDEFANISSTQAALVSKWYGKIDASKKDKIFLAALLQETGKILIADVVLQADESDQFSSEVEHSYDIPAVEKSFVEDSTSTVTAAIFTHWKMDDELVEMISHSDDPTGASEAVLPLAKALHVVKTAVPVNAPLSENNITRALVLAKKYGFDHELLEDCIDEILG